MPEVRVAAVRGATHVQGASGTGGQEGVLLQYSRSGGQPRGDTLIQGGQSGSCTLLAVRRDTLMSKVRETHIRQ